MVKVLVLLKSVQCELSVHLVKSTVSRSDILHSSNSTQEVSDWGVSSCVLSLQSDRVKRRKKFDILRSSEFVGLAQKLGSLGTEWLKLLHFSQENKLLVGREVFQVGRA